MPVSGSNSISTHGNALKKLYKPTVVEAKIYLNNPTFAKIRKIGDFEGSSYENSVEVSQGQGVGPTVALAKANRSEDTYERFSVPRRLVYGVGSIDGELLRAAKTSRGTQAVNALQRARDNNLKAVRRYLQHSLWNNGGGALGKIAAGGISGAVITLDDPNSVVWFERKMILQLSADDGTGGGGVEAGTVTILSVDRDQGKITCTGNVTAGIATAAAGQFIFRNGTYNAVFDGIPKWIPKTPALAATALYGVTRSNDVSRLAGLRFASAQGANIIEALLLAMARCAREGIEPTACPMHPDDLLALVMAGQDKVQYSRNGVSGKLEVGFSGDSIKVVSPTGLAVEVYPDAGVTKGDGWLLTLSSWEYHYAGGALPELLQDDGVPMLRESDDDTYTWRVGGYGNLMCVSPQDNMYFPLPGLAGEEREASP